MAALGLQCVSANSVSFTSAAFSSTFNGCGCLKLGAFSFFIGNEDLLCFNDPGNVSSFDRLKV